MKLPANVLCDGPSSRPPYVVSGKSLAKYGRVETSTSMKSSCLVESSPSMSTSESRLPIYQKTSTSVEMWVPQLNLYLAEKHALSNQWLSDAIIHAAQVLIKNSLLFRDCKVHSVGES